MLTMKFCPQCARPLDDRETAGRVRRVCADEACGYVFYDNPLPVVAALVEHDGNVLLARNKGWPAGWFGLITGFLERGESPGAGILRELKEEVGLEGEIVSLIGVYEFPQRNEVIMAYHVRAHGTVVLGDEIEAVKSVPPDKLRAWPFGTGLAVKDWLEARQRSA
jgi:NADH pyrophosphatase NudC (nudix superfamily)